MKILEQWTPSKFCMFLLKHTRTIPCLVWTRSPGAVRAATSGTTMGVPTNSTVSPARHLSTASFLTMTSMERGRLPAGTCTATSLAQPNTGGIHTLVCFVIGKEGTVNTAQMAKLFDILQPRGWLIAQRAYSSGSAQSTCHTLCFGLLC